MLTYIETNLGHLSKDETNFDKHHYEAEVKELKRKLSLALQGINDSNNTGFASLEKDRGIKASLYESLIIHLKNNSLRHLLEIYHVNLKREEEIQSILEKKKISSDYDIKKQLNDLCNNFITLKKLCETTFKDYESRSKMYILPEVIFKLNF
jgi:hypothetical protein